MDFTSICRSGKTIRGLARGTCILVSHVCTCTYNEEIACQERLNFALMSRNQIWVIVILTSAYAALHSARWNSAEVKSRREVVMVLNHFPVRTTFRTMFLSCSFISFFFSLLLYRFAVLSPSLKILLYPFFHGSSHVTNEPERALRIGHGELRTEIPSYGVTDREWSRTPRGRVSSWEARNCTR